VTHFPHVSTFPLPAKELANFGVTVADPSEMAAAMGFLASTEAGYITGVVLPVDGGISI
jgi:3-oxoacyl-[acyl-carrier protein] reductase